MLGSWKLAARRLTENMKTRSSKQTELVPFLQARVSVSNHDARPIAGPPDLPCTRASSSPGPTLTGVRVPKTSKHAIEISTPKKLLSCADRPDGQSSVVHGTHCPVDNEEAAAPKASQQATALQKSTDSFTPSPSEFIKEPASCSSLTARVQAALAARELFTGAGRSAEDYHVEASNTQPLNVAATKCLNIKLLSSALADAQQLFRSNDTGVQPATPLITRQGSPLALHSARLITDGTTSTCGYTLNSSDCLPCGNTSVVVGRPTPEPTLQTQPSTQLRNPKPLLKVIEAQLHTSALSPVDMPRDSTGPWFSATNERCDGTAPSQPKSNSASRLSPQGICRNDGINSTQGIASDKRVEPVDVMWQQFQCQKQSPLLSRRSSAAILCTGQHLHEETVVPATSLGHSGKALNYDVTQPGDPYGRVRSRKTICLDEGADRQQYHTRLGVVGGSHVTDPSCTRRAHPRKQRRLEASSNDVAFISNQAGDVNLSDALYHHVVAPSIEAHCDRICSSTPACEKAQEVVSCLVPSSSLTVPQAEAATPMKRRKRERVVMAWEEQEIGLDEPPAQQSVWEPPVSPFGLLEEQVYNDPWRVMLACMLLNKTSANEVRTLAVCAFASEVFIEIKLLLFWIFCSCNIFLIIKINNFRGDLSDVSATTATLAFTSANLAHPINDLSI